MSKVPPAAMFRLPADRPSNNGGGPIIEPSQQFCPHWLLVVAHQAVREIYYMSSDVQRQLCGGCFASTVYRPIGIKKRVLFVRHGQGAHNQTIANWGLVDPELTAEGEAQVAALHEELLNPDLNPEGVEGIELIAVSPLTRAMQTATGGFAGLRVPYVVTPLLRERLGAPCDTGRTRTELLRCFPKMMEWEGIDELPELWWSTETEYADCVGVRPIASLISFLDCVPHQVRPPRPRRRTQAMDPHAPRDDDRCRWSWRALLAYPGLPPQELRLQVARRRAVSRSEQQARQAREPTGGDEWGGSEHTGPSMSICEESRPRQQPGTSRRASSSLHVAPIHAPSTRFQPMVFTCTTRVNGLFSWKSLAS
jgi:hypothetical protein